MALCSFREDIRAVNFYMYNIKEGIIQSTKYLLFPITDKLCSEGNKIPRTPFEARKVAGSAKCKQSETGLGKIRLFTHVIDLFTTKKEVNEGISLLIKIPSPKLHSAPLKEKRTIHVKISYKLFYRKWLGRYFPKFRL